MEELYTYEGISINLMFIYYAIVFLGALYILYHFSINKLSIFFILIFWDGLFYFLGFITAFNYNLYKIFVFLYALILFGSNIFKRYDKKDVLINIAFLLFSISFWISFLINEQSFITIASQYCKKYSIPFLFYHGIKNIHINQKKAFYFSRLLYVIVILQILFSIVKIILVGGFTEPIVGSISGGGAGTAVVFPMIGFSMIYVYKKGSLNNKDWWIIISLMLVALASNKRSPVFLFPIFIILLLTYVKRSVRLIALIKYIPIAFLLFYIGVRSNYTLNPEHSTWGSFDIRYVYRYVMKYNFGVEDLDEIEEAYYGRGASVGMVFSPAAFNFKNYKKLLFGNGLQDVVTHAKGKFLGKDYGFEHQGITGYAVLHIYTLGYIGFVFYLFFCFSVISVMKNKRFRIVLLIFYLWELFLYGGNTFNSNAISIIVIFVIIYYNFIFANKVNIGYNKING